MLMFCLWLAFAMAIIYVPFQGFNVLGYFETNKFIPYVTVVYSVAVACVLIMGVSLILIVCVLIGFLNLTLGRLLFYILTIL